MIAALKVVLSSALSGLLGLDAVQAGQFLLSRPAFVGPVLGWLNGCPLEGARLGILLELLYIDFIPVGGVVPPNGTAAAAAGVLAHSAGGLAPSLCFFWGLAAGTLFSPIEYRLRASRSPWNAVIEAQVRSGEFSLQRWLAKSMLIENASLGAYVLAWTALAAGLAWLPGISALYPGTDFAYSLMPWLGLSGLYFRFRTQIYKKG
ncbi:MAG: PTS sugar transporter subunit IIC [Elusimicrobiota bacterium]|nr:PTS sugar transporter subunit IIC [Elusimicrobiota bacterium]